MPATKVMPARIAAVVLFIARGKSNDDAGSISRDFSRNQASAAGRTSPVADICRRCPTRFQLVPGADAHAEVLVALREIEERTHPPLVMREEAEHRPRKDAEIEAEREVLACRAVAES